jgi:hypothetical protein
MKKLFSIVILSALVAACSPDKPKTNDEAESYESLHGSDNAVAENATNVKALAR